MVRECADGMLMCCCGVDLCNCKQCKSSDPCKMSRLAPKVPVGFRFHPTEEELVGYYLPKKVSDRRIDLDLIRELDLYKFEPWDLHRECKPSHSDASVLVIDAENSGLDLENQ